jgi:DNA polymerase III sliding clamp (beta) subunit (PCNA family)
MHVKVDPVLLKEAVTKLRHVHKIPSLGIDYVIYCLKAQEETLEIIASDIETISIKISIKAEVLQEGYVNINGTNFSKVITKFHGALGKEKKNKTDTIELILEGNQLILNTRTSYSVGQRIKNTRDFSLVDFDLSEEADQLADQDLIFLEADNLKNMLNVASSIIDPKNSDYIELSGVSFKITDGTLRIAGCDGPRLVECTSKIDSDRDINVILPKIFCNVIYVSVSPDDKAGLTFSDRSVRFELYKDELSMIMVASLIYGQYPDFDSFFDINGKTIQVNTELLYDNLININDLLGDDSFKLLLEVKKDKMSLRGAGSLTKKIKNEGLSVRSDFKGNLSTVVNSFSLKSVLSFVKSDSTSLTIGDTTKPIVITPVNENKTTFSFRGLISAVN